MRTVSEPPRYPCLEMGPRMLLGPGPSMVHPRVLQAMAGPVIGHLDPAFLQVMDRIQDMLRYVFQTANPLTIPVSGTGSAAMEAAVANSVEPGQPVLVCVERFLRGPAGRDGRAATGARCRPWTCPWGEVFDPGEGQGGAGEPSGQGGGYRARRDLLRRAAAAGGHGPTRSRPRGLAVGGLRGLLGWCSLQVDELEHRYLLQRQPEVPERAAGAGPDHPRPTRRAGACETRKRRCATGTWI